jgi:hypothetical protein
MQEWHGGKGGVAFIIGCDPVPGMFLLTSNINA